MKMKIYLNKKIIKEINDTYTEEVFYLMGEAMYEHFKKTYEPNIDIALKDDNDNLLVEFRYKKRGTTEIEGEIRPSHHCYSQYINYSFAENVKRNRVKLEETELRYTSSERNSYKRYKMYELEPDKNYFYIGYGSLDLTDDELRKVKYEWFVYWAIYFEKLSKGYLDMSEVFCEEKADTESLEDKSIEQKEKDVSDTLYDMLYQYSLDFASKYVENVKPTKKQIEKLKALIEELKTIDTLSSFNDKMKEIVVLSPRKRNPLSDTILKYYAKDKDDFNSIIEFETKLLMSLEVLANEKGKTLENVNAFKTNDIEIFEATDSQKEEVLRHLSVQYQTRVKSVYRVINKTQKESFDNYLKKNNVKTVKQFWHGSVNSNWLSIVTNGLKIRNKVANGRMFGDGLYFAPDCDKSFGYTSYYGSRWARGNDGTAIMGLYATAYGEAYNPTTTGNAVKVLMETHNKNCVHARAKDMGLYRDEIIFYDNDAICLNYLVIFN